MSPNKRELNPWISKVVGDKLFPVLCLQVKSRLNLRNRQSPSDSPEMFAFKSGKKEAVDEIFDIIMDLSEAEPIRLELEGDFAVDPSVHKKEIK